MAKINVVNGARFGMLTVIKELPSRKRFYEKRNKYGYKRIFLCQCDCGNFRKTSLYPLMKGLAWNCGCKRRPLPIKHGYTHTRYYHTWAQIKARCFNLNSSDYSLYGGRGITLYEPWINDAAGFIEYIKNLDGWDNPSLSLDRINVNGNYEPGNLRWATAIIQALNKRVKSTNTSGYTGISYVVSKQAYVVVVRVNKVSIYIGQFKNKKDAVDARNEYITNHHLENQKIQQYRGD